MVNPNKLRLLKIIVIILGFAIFFLISLIIFKVARGDLDKKSTFTKIEKRVPSKEYLKLLIPNEYNIKTISGKDEDILILLEGSNEQKIISIHNNKLKVIDVEKGNIFINEIKLIDNQMISE